MEGPEIVRGEDDPQRVTRRRPIRQRDDVPEVPEDEPT